MLDMSSIQMVKQSLMVELFGHPIPFETVQKLDIWSGLQMVSPFYLPKTKTSGNKMFTVFNLLMLLYTTLAT